MNIRKVPARNVFLWLKSAWIYFKADPLLWVGMALAWFVLTGVLVQIPPLGPVLNIVIFPVIYAGFLYGVRELQAGRELQFEYLWYALRDASTRARVLALALLPLSYGIFTSLTVLLPGFLPLTGLLFAITSVVVTLALLFAVPLVLFDNLDPLTAVKHSLQASVHNAAALGLFLVLNLVVGGLIALLTYGIGPVVLLPITFATLFFAYQDIIGPAR